MTIMKIAAQLATGHNAVQGMVKSLGYRQVCFRWAPRLHKRANTNVSIKLPQLHATDGDDFLLSMVTDDDKWFHHFSPESKRQNTEFHQATSPKKKFRRIPSADKITGTYSGKPRVRTGWF
jgi:hypothetical protein